MGEYHRFKVDIAVKYGIPCALVLGHIDFMVQNAQANGEKRRDGKYWMRKSAREFGDLYPYLTKSQIRHALEKLRREGLIHAQHFKSSECSKTLWYTPTREARRMLSDASPETQRSVTSDKPDCHETQTDAAQETDRASPETQRSVTERIPSIEVNSSLSSSLVDGVNRESEEDARARGSAWSDFVREYEGNIGLLPTSTIEREDMVMFFDEYGVDALREIIHYTARKHPDNPHVYFSNLCRRYLGKGITTAQQAQAAFKDYERTKKGGANSGASRGRADKPPRRIGQETIV